MLSEPERITVCCDLISEVARTSGQATLKLTGTSMVPALWPGDLATVQPCHPAQLRAGDIVLYLSEGVLTAHRLVRLTREHLILRGDSHASCDPPVQLDQVVGRISAVRRGGRLVSLDRSLRQRIIAFMISRSALCMRLLFRLQDLTSLGWPWKTQSNGPREPALSGRPEISVDNAGTNAAGRRGARFR